MKTVLLTLFFLLVTHVISAQPPGMPSAPDQAPIDGGLLTVAGVGVAYAFKKLKKSR